MAKFYGVVGYADIVETSPGVNKEIITERSYFGEQIRNARRLSSSEYVNDDVLPNNEISILADPYAMENFFKMRYIAWMGAKWKITNVEVQWPRLILTIGGVYPE